MAVKDHELLLIISSLTERLGREPSENEVIEFINGDYNTRERIWNQRTCENPECPDLGRCGGKCAREF